MGLDIFFAEDIRNALLAADEASSSTARMCTAIGGDSRDDPPTRLYLRAYLEGYRSALTTVALAFGLSPALIASRGETVEVEARTIGETPSALADDERALVCYAAEHLGGKFNIRDLAEAFRGRISQRRIEQLSRQWEALGWLVAGPTRADGKSITEELLALVVSEG
jgi:hypothetical protein